MPPVEVLNKEEKMQNDTNHDQKLMGFSPFSNFFLTINSNLQLSSKHIPSSSYFTLFPSLHTIPCHNNLFLLLTRNDTLSLSLLFLSFSQLVSLIPGSMQSKEFWSLSRSLPFSVIPIIIESSLILCMSRVTPLTF